MGRECKDEPLDTCSGERQAQPKGTCLIKGPPRIFRIQSLGSVGQSKGMSGLWKEHRFG